MSVPPSETWEVNGVDLVGLAWSLDPAKGRAGLTMTPVPRDLSFTIPGRRGVTRPAGVMYDAGQLVLNLWILGVDPDSGTVPSWSSSLELYEQNVATLTALFSAAELLVRRTRPDGSVRRATGRLGQALEVNGVGGTPQYGELSAVIAIDDAFWFDDQPQIAEATVQSGEVALLWDFAGADAPMDRLEWTLGPSWNPVLTDVPSGRWLAYDAAILPGQALHYDAATGRIYGSGGLFPNMAAVRRGGVFELSPGRPPQVAVTHTGPDLVTVQVAGRRAYLHA
jgi:hypothetical protein